MPNKLTLEEFLRKARLIHKEKYDYSLVVYINNTTLVCIICPIHGEFWQTPANHLSGKGCNDCGIITQTSKRKLTQEEFEKRGNNMHNNEYDYSISQYINYDTNLWLIHKTCGYKFEQTPGHHLQGHGCPKCGKKRGGVKNTKWTKEKCLEQGKKYNTIKEWKNNSASSYQSAFINNWLNECTNHMIRIGNSKERCIYSYEFENVKGLNYVYVGLTYNLEKRHEQHKIRDTVYKFCIKYNLKLPQQKQLSEFVNEEKAIILEDIFLEEYKSKGWIPINKAKTGALGGYVSQKDRKENFIKKSNKIHNNEYDYSNSIYLNNHTNIQIIHKICGFEFPQLPSNHLQGQGCPKCGRIKSIENRKKK